MTFFCPFLTYPTLVVTAYLAPGNPNHLILICIQCLSQTPVSSVAEHWSRKPGVGSSTLPQGYIRDPIGQEVILMFAHLLLSHFFKPALNARVCFGFCAEVIYFSTVSYLLRKF